MKKGEAKIEFFTNLKYLQNEYNDGLVVSKFLYKKAVHEKNFKMTYPQFNKYFNDFLAIKKTVSVFPLVKKEQDDPKSGSSEPLRARINTKEKKVFDALYGKQISDEDLL